MFMYIYVYICMYMYMFKCMYMYKYEYVCTCVCRLVGRQAGGRVRGHDDGQAGMCVRALPVSK